MSGASFELDMAEANYLFAAIEAAGFTVREIGNSECAKLDGGMSCLSLRFTPR